MALSLLKGIELLEAALLGHHDGRRPRTEGLNEHLAVGQRAPRPAGNLHEQAECPFRGAEIGHLESGIRVHDPDELDPGKVQSLGHHLRPDQHVRLSVAEIGQGLSKRLLLFHGVRVDAAHHQGGEMPGELLLDAFRAIP
jgi:hypothetical protein